MGGEVQGSLQTGVATDHIKVPVNGSQGLHTGLSASAMATNRKQGTLRKFGHSLPAFLHLSFVAHSLHRPDQKTCL